MKRIIIYCTLLLICTSIKAQGPGYCLNLDGTNDYVRLTATNGIVPNLSAFTMEVWFKTTKIHTPYGSEGRIVNLHHSSSSGSSASVFVGNRYPSGGSSDEICFLYRNSGSGWNCLYYKTLSSVPYYDGKWHHIAATYNGGGASGVARLYYDGNLVASQAIAYQIPQGTYPAMVGSHDGSSRYFSGNLDEIRIWTVARTQTEILKNMHRELSGSETNLAAYYKMSNGSGTTLTDNTGNSHTGTLINGTGWANSTAPVPFRTISGAGNWSSGASWLSGTVPNSQYAHTYIPYNVNVNIYATCGELRIPSSNTVTIRNNSSIRYYDTLDNQGTIRIQSSNTSIGSFVENGTRKNTGTMIVERLYTADGWHYTSSPVASLKTGIFQGAALYKYNETIANVNDRWIAVGSYENLTTGKGYDAYFIGTDKTVTFSGTYNNGNVSLGLTKTTDGFNLMGNPYPSTIDWDASSGWSRTNINTTMYIWDPLAFQIQSYPVGGPGVNGGSNLIASTQGFFVIASAATTLGMTNDVRVHNYGAPRSSKASNYLRIKVTGKNNTDESIIKFDPNATFLFDDRFDGKKFYSYNTLDPQIYTLDHKQMEYVINTLPYSGNSLRIPLSLYVGIDGDYTLSFDVSKLEEKLIIYLEDLRENKIIDLVSNPDYPFSALMSDDRNRFLLHFIPIQTLSTETNSTTSIDEKIDKDIIVTVHGKNLLIKCKDYYDAEIMLFDLIGQKVFTDKLTGDLYSKALNLSSGAYILKINTVETLYTKKIVFK